MPRDSCLLRSLGFLRLSLLVGQREVLRGTCDCSPETPWGSQLLVAASVRQDAGAAGEGSLATGSQTALRCLLAPHVKRCSLDEAGSIGLSAT